MLLPFKQSFYMNLKSIFLIATSLCLNLPSLKGEASSDGKDAEVPECNCTEQMAYLTHPSRGGIGASGPFTLDAKNLPVVTVQENNRLEDLADGTGVNEWRFMTNSGLGVAWEAEKMVHSNPRCKVTILVGKGYKGGNALWGGYLLLQKGYPVEAYLLSPIEDAPDVCKRIVSMFNKAGGVIKPFDSGLELKSDLIIDGLVGTGFAGAAKGRLAEAISWANQQGCPILAVDLPSGLNANTGAVETVAIRAEHTIAISFPKIGFFLSEGPDHVGSFSVINIGLDAPILALVKPEAYVSDEPTAALDKPVFIADYQAYEVNASGEIVESVSSQKF